MIDAREITANEEELLSCNVSLINVLFKDKEAITLKDFSNIKSSLNESLWHYEFYNLDPDENDTISAENFAKSLLSTLSFNKAQSYLKQISEI